MTCLMLLLLASLGYGHSPLRVYLAAKAHITSEPLVSCTGTRGSVGRIYLHADKRRHLRPRSNRDNRYKWTRSALRPPVGWTHCEVEVRAPRTLNRELATWNGVRVA